MKSLSGRGTWRRARENSHPAQAGAREWIRGLRARLGLTQPELAARVGVYPTTVARWEMKGGQYPRACHIARLVILEKKKGKR